MPRDVACGSCAYCHTALIHNFIIESSDKKKSAVGCDCVAKTGDQGLVNSIKLMQKKLRLEKRHAAMAEKYESEIAQQKEKNGGLTDAEVFAEKRALALQERAKLESVIIEKLMPFIGALNRAGGDFCQSMLEQLTSCNLDLSNRCIRIIIEVTAKESGRKGSKKYNERYDQLENMMLDALADYENLPAIQRGF
jgi:hypothetical protein